MSKIDELLAVLDETEEKQRKAIGNLVIKQRSHDVKCLDWTGSDWTITPCRHCGKTWETYSKRTKDKSVCKGPFVYKGSLADLAFRLNDGLIAGKRPIEWIIDALIKGEKDK